MIVPALSALTAAIAALSGVSCTNIWAQNELGLTAAPPKNHERLTYQKKIHRHSIPIPGSVARIADVPKVDRRTIFAAQAANSASRKVKPFYQPQNAIQAGSASRKVRSFYDQSSSSTAYNTGSTSTGRIRSNAVSQAIPPSPPVDNNSFVYTNLTANQWTEFFFAEPGQLPFSRWQFNIASGQNCTLQVTDAYCTGDQFQAVRLLGNNVEEVLFNTPPVPFDPVVAAQIKAGSNVNCTPFTTDAATAWASPSWSKNQIALGAGSYRLILKSLLAPYGSGGAYLQLNCNGSPTPSGNTCSYGSSKIQFLNQKVAWNQIASACSSVGLTPLAVTTGNLNDALSVLFSCGGAASQAWVGSFNGDTYQNQVGLYLLSGLTMGSGGLHATPDASLLYNVMCQ